MFDEPKAFSGFSVDDLNKARDFYGGVLGLEFSEENDGLHIHMADDYEVLVFQKPDHRPTNQTILNFPVENIGPVVEELWNRGVQFEFYYDNQDEKGICRGGGGPNMAWFKDPAGNIVAVIEVEG